MGMLQGLYSDAPLGTGVNEHDLIWLCSVDDTVAYALAVYKFRALQPYEIGLS